MDITAINATEHFHTVMAMQPMRRFLTLSMVLERSPSLWYTPYGKEFTRLGGGSPPFERPTQHNYIVVIYNRYERDTI
jgi:hypothetical protein